MTNKDNSFKVGNPTVSTSPEQFISCCFTAHAQYVCVPHVSKCTCVLHIVREGHVEGSVSCCTIEALERVTVIIVWTFLEPSGNGSNHVL